jgi:hypothetical protein
MRPRQPGPDAPALADRDAQLFRPGADIADAPTACRTADESAEWLPDRLAALELNCHLSP